MQLFKSSTLRFFLLGGFFYQQFFDFPLLSSFEDLEVLSLINLPVFLYHLLLEFWKVFIYNYNYVHCYIYLHAWQSLYPRRQTIVIMLSHNLVTWYGIQSHSSNFIISFKQFYKVIISAYFKMSLFLNLQFTLDIWPLLDIKPIYNDTLSTLWIPLEVLYIL